MKKCVYSGSFDVLHNGHMSVIATASSMFDEVVVAVANNPNKKYLFTLDERVNILKEVASRFSNVRIVPILNEFLIDYATINGINFIVRGIRNQNDLQFEKEMSDFHHEVNPDIKTIWIPSETNISSSFVKGVLGLKDWQDKVIKMVPVEVYGRLINMI